MTKVVINMNIAKIKNAVTRQYVEITDAYLEDKAFTKALAKNVEKIIAELEKYFVKSGIICKFDYYFAKKDEK